MPCPVNGVLDLAESKEKIRSYGRSPEITFGNATSVGSCQPGR